MEILTKGTYFCKILNADCLTDCMKEVKYKENKATKSPSSTGNNECIQFDNSLYQKNSFARARCFLDGDKIEVPSP